MAAPFAGYSNPGFMNNLGGNQNVFGQVNQMVNNTGIMNPYQPGTMPQQQFQMANSGNLGAIQAFGSGNGFNAGTQPYGGGTQVFGSSPYTSNAYPTVFGSGQQANVDQFGNPTGMMSPMGTFVGQPGPSMTSSFLPAAGGGGIVGGGGTTVNSGVIGAVPSSVIGSSTNALVGGPGSGRHYWKVKRTNPQVRVMVRIGKSKPTPLHFELFEDVAPNTVAAFLSLCREKRRGAPGYIGTRAYRIRPSSGLFFGDFGKGDGTGGVAPDSGAVRPDPKNEKTKRHFGPGALSFVNDGPSANTSLFFVTLGDAAEYDHRHTVFGQLIAGFKALTAFNSAGADPRQRPRQPLEIADVERLPLSKNAALPGGLVWDAANNCVINDASGGGGGNTLPAPAAGGVRERVDAPAGVYLPEGWEAARDDGRLYYWNRRTRERSWDPPVTLCARCAQAIPEYPTRYEAKFYHTQCYADMMDGIPVGARAAWDVPHHHHDAHGHVWTHGPGGSFVPQGSFVGDMHVHATTVPGHIDHVHHVPHHHHVAPSVAAAPGIPYTPQPGLDLGGLVPPEGDLAMIAGQYGEDIHMLRRLWLDEAAWRRGNGYDPTPDLGELRSIAAARAHQRGVYA